LGVRVGGILLGAGESRRFVGGKLEARLFGVRLADLACAHFLDAGLSPVVFVGDAAVSDPRVVCVRPRPPTARMIETLRLGIRALPPGPFAFAPADMPALTPDLLRALVAAFASSKRRYLVPTYADRRGHPAFASDGEAFFRLGDRDGPREVFRAAGDELQLHPVDTPDILFDVDSPEDLAAAGDPASRRARLLARGDLR
jgi:CTP:molybdopterin cytidylyltransferase MocA